MQEHGPYTKLLTGLFRQHDNAGRAYNAALKLGYEKDEISILKPEETKHKHSQERRNAELRRNWCRVITRGYY